MRQSCEILVPGCNSIWISYLKFSWLLVLKREGTEQQCESMIHIEMTNSLTRTQQSEFSHIAPHHHFYWICPDCKGEEDYGTTRMGIVFIQPHIFWNFQEVLTVTYCEFIFQESSWNISYSSCCWFWTYGHNGNELLVCKALPHFTCNTDWILSHCNAYIASAL